MRERPLNSVDALVCPECGGLGFDLDGLKQQLLEQSASTSTSTALAVSIPDAAALIGIGETKLRELTKAGEIPVISIGAARRIRVTAIEDYLLRHERQAFDSGEAPPIVEEVFRHGKTKGRQVVR